MKEHNINKTEMALKLETSRSALQRLLNPKNPSITLLTLSKAAAIVAKK
jgi:antitoxin HicB